MNILWLIYSTLPVHMFVASLLCNIWNSLHGERQGYFSEHLRGLEQPLAVTNWLGRWLKLGLSDDPARQLELYTSDRNKGNFKCILRSVYTLLVWHGGSGSLPDFLCSDLDCGPHCLHSCQSSYPSASQQIGELSDTLPADASLQKLMRISLWHLQQSLDWHSQCFLL